MIENSFRETCACPDCRVPRMRWSPVAGEASAAPSRPRWRRPAPRSPCSAATAPRWMKPSPRAPRISPAVADVADQAAVSAAIAEAAARQPIDILVANAGAAEVRAVRQIRRGAVPAHDGCQLHGRGSCRPGRAAGDEASGATGASSRSPRPRASRAMPMSAPISLPSMPSSAWCARWRWSWPTQA